MLKGGQVICGLNATRRLLNAEMKAAAGFPGVYPEGRDEKIICLKNRNDLGLMNGMFLSLDDVRDEDEHSFSAVACTEDGGPRSGAAALLQGRVRRPYSLQPQARGARLEDQA